MNMTDDEIERIIGCAIEVHKALGPGLLESIYHECLILELRTSGLAFEIELGLPISRPQVWQDCC